MSAISPCKETQDWSEVSSCEGSWHLLIVNSHSEKKVARALAAKGFDVLLPLRRERVQYSDRVKVKDRPLFACFVFCRYVHPKDYVRVVSTPGVLTGKDGNSRPTPVPESEIAALQALVASGFPIVDAPAQAGGKRVRIRTNASVPVEGMMAEGSGPCRVYVNLQALGRSVAVEIPTGAALDESL